ncbi:MAG: lysylphosphatidylglycerol synthase transmembrane domain-containing protein [Candidatus Bathyarchaeia archaeon]
MAVGISVLVAFIYFVGLDSLVRVLLQVNPTIILAMVGIQLLGFTFYATAWYALIRSTGSRLPFLTCQGITFASIFASYTMPSGIFLEAVRCILASKESGMTLGESTATVVLHRVLYIVGFLASTSLAFVVLILGGRVTTSVIFQLAALPVLAVAGLIASLFLSLNPKIMQPLLDRALRLVQPVIKIVQKQGRMNGKAGQFLNDYHIAFRGMLSSRTHVAASFAASLGDWACSVLILWVVLVAVSSSVSLWVVLVTMAIGKMIQMTPIAVPGMLGIYETAITASLSLFGVPVAVAASAALLSRIVTFWLDLPVTGIAAYHYGYKALGATSD